MKEQLQKGIVMVFAALSLLVVSLAFGGEFSQPEASLLSLRYRTPAPVSYDSSGISNITPVQSNTELPTDPPSLYLGQPSTQEVVSPNPAPTSTSADSIPWFPSPTPTVTAVPSGSPTVVPSTKPTASPTPSPTGDYRCAHGVINSRCQITPLPIISPGPSYRPSPVVSFQPIVNPDPLPTIPPLPEPCLPPGIGDWFLKLFGLSVPARCRVVPNPSPCPKPVGFGRFLSIFKPLGCLISQVEPSPSPSLKVTSHPNPNPSESPIPFVSPSPGTTPQTVPDVIRFALRLPDNRNQDVTFEANHRATLYRYDNPASPRLVTKTAQASVKQAANGDRYVDFSGGDLSTANLTNYCVELQFRFKTNSPAYQNGYKASTYLAYTDSEYQIGNGVFSYNKGGGQKTVYGSGYHDTTAGRTTFCPSKLVR